MRLYIDPGTGSMLFAILIGLLGALRYLLKAWLVKVRFRLSGGKGAEVAQESCRLSSFLTISATGMFSSRSAASCAEEVLTLPT